MPIHPSSSAEIRQLIEALGGTHEVARESAIARLSVIGARAVDHLLNEFAAADPRARTGILRAFEALADPRALPVARRALDDTSPEVQTAGIGAMRGLLTSPQSHVSRDALDALVSVAVDGSRDGAVRIAAFDALRDLPPDVLDPIRAKLATDGNPRMRARAIAATPAAADAHAADDEDWRDALEGRFSASPDRIKRALAARRGSVKLTELHRLVDRLRAQEQREGDIAQREAWRAVRGAAHQALAARNSRLALYDLRESLVDAERLPVTFLAALEDIGDGSCLEALAAAYDAASSGADPWWREHVADAFRAIVQREGLTRRHAAVKRAMARWPEAAADLMARV